MYYMSSIKINYKNKVKRHTMEEEHRKGYGKPTAALATHNLMQMGIYP